MRFTVLLIVCAVLSINVVLASHSKTPREKFGDVAQFLIPVTGLGLTYWKNDEKGRSQFWKGFATNFIVTYTLKVVVNEKRPGGHGGYSYPSGHTSSSFQGASFIQRRYGWKLGVPAYLAAAYVAYTRVDDETRMHFNDDIFAGALIGIGSSYLFTTPKGSHVAPIVNRKSLGLELGFTF